MPSFVEVVKALKDAYRSIDLRIVMRRQTAGEKIRQPTETTQVEEESWIADVVTVRLGNESVGAISSRLNDLGSTYPIRAETFRVVMVAKPISEWETLCDALQQGGEVSLDTEEITLPSISLEQDARPYC